jgi:hypothetical protein
MKKIALFICSIIVFLSSGCFDSVEEITVDNSGGGVFVSTADMSNLISMVKTFAGDKLEGGDKKMEMDTLVNLRDIKDSLDNLTPDEKKLLEQATLKIKMSLKEEKFSLTFNFPYSHPADILAIGTILKKTKNQIITKQMDKMNPGSGNNSAREMAGLDKEGNSFEVSDYFNFSVKKGYLSKKLNKDKYANAEKEESLKSLKEMSQMGLNSTMKTIINLPKPAKKAEGKAVKLSTDKKTVTIEGTLDDFFEDASFFEYEIEY